MEEITFRQIAEALCQELRAEAERLGDAAGYGGRWDDGGQKMLEEKVNAFAAGIAHRFPQEWVSRADAIALRLRQRQQDAEKRKDPEWAEFERLQKKFSAPPAARSARGGE